jgi:hypothetical protein
MNLTPEMLRVLATGCDYLNDGDERDRAQVDAVERAMVLEEGLIRSNNCWYPKEQATSGYTREYGSVFKTYAGDWTNGRADLEDPPVGTELFFDEACTIKLRETD